MNFLRGGGQKRRDVSLHVLGARSVKQVKLKRVNQLGLHKKKKKFYLFYFFLLLLGSVHINVYYLECKI